MRMWAIGTASATLLTAGFVAFGAGPAVADVTNGNDSILGGNQVNAPISIPVNASGNSIAVLGRALAGSTGGAFVQGARSAGGHNRTSGRHSILGGNQVNAPVNVPINACGNSVAALGGALSGCRGGAGVHTVGYADGGHDHTSGVGSIGGGNQVNLPVNAPVNVCGNAAAALGDALGVPVHGVCTLDAIATDAGDGPLVVVTDARRREVYWAAFDGARRLDGPRVEAPAALRERIPGLGVLAAAGAMAEVTGLPVREPASPSPAGLVAVAAGALRGGHAPGPLEPLYLRRPDAQPPGARKKVTA